MAGIAGVVEDARRAVQDAAATTRTGQVAKEAAAEMGRQARDAAASKAKEAVREAPSKALSCARGIVRSAADAVKQANDRVAR